ncbi:hypothetical protein GCM10010970_23740 [Silvimonas iriomotensis]|uniref:Uncharacterized protein n=1 Tax=Silvimonas iriomotensis TaxID=449662 RepID=A0ABQ2PAQ9_9NEIS|nr:hypothetical protein GCM10010970_23740 [Silvimonas iriomotensis]
MPNPNRPSGAGLAVWSAEQDMGFPFALREDKGRNFAMRTRAPDHSQIKLQRQAERKKSHLPPLAAIKNGQQRLAV